MTKGILRSHERARKDLGKLTNKTVKVLKKVNKQGKVNVAFDKNFWKISFIFCIVIVVGFLIAIALGY